METQALEVLCSECDAPLPVVVIERSKRWPLNSRGVHEQLDVFTGPCPCFYRPLPRLPMHSAVKGCVPDDVYHLCGVDHRP